MAAGEQFTGVYVYFRYNDKKSVMVAFNKSEEARKLDRNYFYERVENFEKGTDVLTGKTYSLDQLSVPGRSVLVLKLEQ